MNEKQISQQYECSFKETSNPLPFHSPTLLTLRKQPRIDVIWLRYSDNRWPETWAVATRSLAARMSSTVLGLTEKRKQWIKEIHARNRCNRATETKQRLWCSVVELRGIWHMQRCDFCPLASHCFLPAKWKHLCVQPWWLLSTAVTLNSGSCHPTPRGGGGCALMMWLELANCEPQPVHCRQTVPRGVPRRSETFGSVSAWKFVLLSKVKKKSTSSRLSDSTM